MNLREKAVRGVAWSAIEKWGTQAISFLVFLILARLLGPETFGLVAMASVFTAFMQMFLDQGLAEAIVQRADLEQEHLDTAFWTNSLTGSLLTVCSILLSGVIADFYNEPRLAPVVTWLSLTFLLAALSSTQQAILKRRLDFRSLATRTLVARASGGVIGIGAAVLGYGVWSLVAQTLTNGLVGVLVLWRISDWRPGSRVSKKHFRELFTFGINIVANRAMTFVNTRLDDFLIGYFLGPTALGYYRVAYRMLRLMIDLLTGITTSVTFPAFSRLQQQPERARRVFYQATQLTSLVAFPAFLGVAALAPELVMILFGTDWTSSIPVMQILALVGLLQSVFNFNGNLVMALGKPAWILGIKTITTIANIIAFILVVQWGIVAVAAAYVIVNYGIAPLSLWMVDRLVCLDFRKYLNQFVPPVTGSLAMVIALVISKYVLGDWSGVYGQFVVYALTGALAYLGIVGLVRPSLLRQLLNLSCLIGSQWKLGKLER